MSATEGVLKSSLGQINDIVEKNFMEYLEEKKDSGAIPTTEEASAVIDKDIQNMVDFYAPLSATKEQSDWLLEQASLQKSSLLGLIVEVFGGTAESGATVVQKSTNRNDDTESIAAGISSTSPVTSTSQASGETSSSVLLDSMFGNLGKRNAFTVHNVNGRRYYSTIDATIFLNGKIVEEVVQLQWTIDENTMPLFGYNSYIWDDVAKGSRIISGAFAINFTIPDYLDLLIDGAEDSSMSFKNEGKVIEKNDRAARWGKGFTIGVGYGSADSVIGEQPCLFLESVRLKSSGQAFDTQGKQLVEIYQFIARDWHVQR